MADIIHKTIRIWENIEPPEDNGLFGDEEHGECIGNISEAVMDIYYPLSKNKNITILLIAGGGYGVVCTEPEGSPALSWLLDNGITAVMLKYRLPNGHHKVPLQDTCRAVRILRYNAEELKVAGHKIGVWGFSAGGHLASSLSTLFNKTNEKEDRILKNISCRPDFSILFYPVITMRKEFEQYDTKINLLGDEKAKDEKWIKYYSNERNISGETPPTFLLHCVDDDVVNVEHSLLYFRNLRKNNIPAECLLYERGGHGPNAFLNNPSWEKSLYFWIERRLEE